MTAIDDAHLQRAIRDACFDESPDFSNLPPRIAIYRRLVRNTLRGVVENLLPRTCAQLGADFERDFSSFLAERGPQTHYLRDVPRELVAWAEGRWARDGRAPWLVELARHEIASFAVSTAPHIEEPQATDVALDKPLLLSSPVRIERFAHAIHEELLPPPVRDFALLYHRDDEHSLCTLELSPLAAALLLRAHVHVAPTARSLALREAIAAACDETGAPMNDETLVSIARLLADLGERGIVLGAPTG